MVIAAIRSYFLGMRKLIVIPVKMEDAFIFGSLCYVIALLTVFLFLAVMAAALASVLNGFLGFDTFTMLLSPIAILVAPSAWVGGALTSERMLSIFGLYRIAGIRERVLHSSIKKYLNI
jgi:hypothetical protein